MRKWFVALIVALLVVTPTAAAKPAKPPLTLTYDYGGPTHFCNSTTGYSNNDTHYRAWNGYMKPGEIFTVSMYFCPPDGGNMGAYGAVEGLGNYLFSFHCTDAFGNLCTTVKLSDWSGQTDEFWTGCEAEPSG